MTSHNQTRILAVAGRDLTKTYGIGAAEVHALDGVDVDFFAGQFTAIMGPSGSGKSTLMHLLAGLDTASSGHAYVGDTDLTTLNDNALTQLRGREIGFIFQQFNLLPMLTAAQNITLPLELSGQKVDQGWYDLLIDTLGIRERLNHRPSEMSGGQQQRVAIARALVTKPAVVFADEPTGNLDTRAGAEVLDFLRRAVRELGATVIMVTHDPAAAAYADRVLMLADGHIVGDMDHPAPTQVVDALAQISSVGALTQPLVASSNNCISTLVEVAA